MVYEVCNSKQLLAATGNNVEKSDESENCKSYQNNELKDAKTLRGNVCGDAVILSTTVFTLHPVI